MSELFEVEPKKEIIRALWWKQPFASLMLHGKIETRRYPTKVRGKVLICACKTPYTFEQVSLLSCDSQIMNILDLLCSFSYSALIRTESLGQAIAIGDLVDCRPHTLQDMPKSFVNHDAGLFSWIFENVQHIEPFEIKGKQGWAILDEETKAKIKIL
jgi:hypothetical protein